MTALKSWLACHSPAPAPRNPSPSPVCLTFWTHLLNLFLLPCRCPSLSYHLLPPVKLIDSCVPCCLSIHCPLCFETLGQGAFPSGSVVKNPTASAGDAGDAGSIPGSGRSPGEGNGNPLQYSCLENPLETPSGLQSMGSKRVGRDSDWATATTIIIIIDDLID